MPGLSAGTKQDSDLDAEARSTPRKTRREKTKREPDPEITEEAQVQGLSARGLGGSKEHTQRRTRRQNPADSGRNLRGGSNGGGGGVIRYGEWLREASGNCGRIARE